VPLSLPRRKCGGEGGHQRLRVVYFIASAGTIYFFTTNLS